MFLYDFPMALWEKNKNYLKQSNKCVLNTTKITAIHQDRNPEDVPRQEASKHPEKKFITTL